MKTQAEVLAGVRAGRNRGACEMLDGRDYARLAEFFPASEIETFGFNLKPDAGPWEPKAWTEEVLLAQLREDVEFGFKKALDERGISSELMNAVIKMWLWVLDDPLQDCDDYAPYGLPLLRAVAERYGFPNPADDEKEPTS